MIWSHDTGQRTPCFDRCQLATAWKSNVKDVRHKPGLGISWSMAVMMCDVIVVVVEHTRPRSMPLAMLTICMHVVLFSIVMVLRLAALLATGAPL